MAAHFWFRHKTFTEEKEMKKQKLSRCITAAVLSAAMMFGTPVLSDGVTELSGLCIDAEAASSDFTVDKSGTLMKYNGKGGKVKIPGKIGGITVKKIPCYIFAGKTVTEIEIPDTVTAIDDEAFCGLDIVRITIPDSVESIGYFAFRDCEKLEQITLGKNLKEIGGWCFEGCKSLKEIHIPAKVTTISKFFDSNDLTGFGTELDSLEKITVDKSNKYFRSIDGVLFTKDGKTLIQIPAAYSKKNYSVPKGVVTILDNAYYSENGNNYGIEKLTIPTSVRTIGECAFMKSGIKTLIIKNGVKTIGNAAFVACGDLKEVTLPKSLKKIDYIFGDCKSLEKVTIPSGVTEIGAGAFKYCGSLKNLSLPKTIKKVSKTAFEGCDDLKIKYNGKTYTLEKFKKLSVCKQ